MRVQSSLPSLTEHQWRQAVLLPGARPGGPGQLYGGPKATTMRLPSSRPRQPTTVDGHKCQRRVLPAAAAEDRRRGQIDAEEGRESPHGSFLPIKRNRFERDDSEEQRG